MIFQTNRLYIRNLMETDLPAFHEMQVNPKVMEYTGGEASSEEKNNAELKKVIGFYDQPNNDFWVWAVVKKEDDAFIGTCAVIKDEKGEKEIGYRFSEKYWGNGYGMEVTEGLIEHCLKTMKLPEIVAYVYTANIASVKILDKSKMKFIKEFINEEGILDRYYKLKKGEI